MMRLCPICHGEPFEDPTDEPCSECDGEGEVDMTSREMQDEHDDLLYDEWVDRQLERGSK